MITELKKQVESVLSEVPETRNSDITLTIAVWERYYPSLIRVGASKDRGIWLKDLYSLPREDNIKRIRADFNKKGMYLTTSATVAKQRRTKEDAWRKALSYRPIGQY